MEEAFCGGHWYLSTHLDIDWVVSFSGQCWPLDINYSHSFDVFLRLAVLNNVDQVLCLAWLTDHHNRLIFCNIFRLQVHWIINIDFLKAFKMLEIPDWGHGSIITRSASNHRKVVSEADLIELFKVRSELDLALLSYFVFIKSLKGFRRLFKYFSIVINHYKPSLFLEFLFGLLDFFDGQLPNLIIFGLEKAIGVVLESYFLGSDINLILFRRKGNKYGLFSGGCVYFAGIILINQHDSPFGVFIQICFHNSERF